MAGRRSSAFRFRSCASRSRTPDAIGFAVTRTVARANETSTWPLLARSASGYVSSFGELRGLRIAGSDRRLELMPYALGQMATAPAGDGNPLVQLARSRHDGRRRSEVPAVAAA